MIFRKPVTEYKTCVSCLQLSLKYFSFEKELRKITIMNVDTSSCKVSLFLSILMKLEYSQQIFEKYQI